MSPISENDKRIWENYIADLSSFGINFQYNKKSLAYNSKKSISKKAVLQSKFKQINQVNFEPEAVLDLHGYRLYNAKITLQKYILNAYEKNLRNILIITGKGHNNSGVLKKEVPLWLNDRILINLLINFRTAPRRFGGEGALLVRIKNKNKFRFT
mgnify:FL=1